MHRLFDPGLTVAVAVSDCEVLRRNLLASPGLFDDPSVRLMLRMGQSSAALAHNASLDASPHDLVMFVHQDVYFPEGWLEGLRESLITLDQLDPEWGVLGCYGVRRTEAEGVGRIWSGTLGTIGREPAGPEPVDTLDEIVLIVRRTSGLRFDPSMPHFHLYGTDLCLTARAQGRRSYALPGYCVHNTRQLALLPKEFYDCYGFVKRKWRACLPIRTSCITISRWDLEMWWRRGERLRHPWRQALEPAARLEDPRSALTGA